MLREQMDLDRIDQKIIRLLEENSRLSFAELAEQVGLSKTPCWKRVSASAWASPTGPPPTIMTS